MYRFATFLTLVLLTSFASAQREPQDYPGEVYALASSAAGSDVPPATGAAGFCIGGAWKPRPRLGLVAEFNRHFVSDNHLGLNTLLTGVRGYSRENLRLSGFFQFLVGAQQTTLTGQPADWNGVFAPGAGADIRLTDHLVWRAIELDAFLHDRGGNLRLASGFAFRFGH